MKHLRFVFAAVVLSAALALTYLPGSKYLTCQVFYRKDASLQTPRGTVDVEIADDAKEQEKGLGHRSCIGQDQGMLFVHQKPGLYSFWMKDMGFPIDIVWIDENYRAVKVLPNVQPSSYPKSFTNEQPALYTLELIAGGASKAGLEKDSLVVFTLVLK